MGRLVIILFAVFLLSCSNDNSTPVYWTWTTTNFHETNAEWDSTMKKLSENHIKGLLISGSEDEIRNLIPIAKKHDIDLHVWIWAMNRGDAKDEWLSVNAKGHSLADKEAYVNYYKFACPAIPEFQDFINSKIESYSKIEGLKGIHLDYNRYVDVILPKGLWDKYGIEQHEIQAEYDYGYHPQMLVLFKEKYGIWPYQLDDYLNNQKWIDFRCNQLSLVVEQLKITANENGKIISSAVFPTPEMSKHMVKQDWGNWNLDYYFPMVYHNFYNEDINWIGEVMKENISQKGTNVFCGLYMPALQNPDDFKKALEQNIKVGAKSVSLFDLNKITDTHYKILKEYYPKFK